MSVNCVGVVTQLGSLFLIEEVKPALELKGMGEQGPPEIV